MGLTDDQYEAVRRLLPELASYSLEPSMANGYTVLRPSFETTIWLAETLAEAAQTIEPRRALQEQHEATDALRTVLREANERADGLQRRVNSQLEYSITLQRIIELLRAAVHGKHWNLGEGDAERAPHHVAMMREILAQLATAERQRDEAYRAGVLEVSRLFNEYRNTYVRNGGDSISYQAAMGAMQECIAAALRAQSEPQPRPQP